MLLRRLGWGPRLSEQSTSFDPALTPGRILEDLGRWCRVQTADAEVLARVAGKLRHEAQEAQSPEELPVTGDWVLLRSAGKDASIVRVLERRTRLIRKASGDKTRPQVLASNVDTALIVQSLHGDFNVRRLERYLITVVEGGVRPVVLLNKVDLCPEAAQRAAEAERVASGVPVHVIGALAGEGIEAVESYLREGETVALLGSSGAGKSTLLNRLAGQEIQRVRAVSETDGRGLHTTTSRRLVLLDRGGLILDMPGIRELALWDAGEGLEQSFADLEEVARECRFRDCSHETEPGCAVRAAIERGAFDPERLESHRKLVRETKHLAIKQDAALKHEETLRVRKIHREMRRSKPR